MSSATAGGTDVRGQGPRRAGQSRSGRASRRVAGREGQEHLPRACGGDPLVNKVRKSAKESPPAHAGVTLRRERIWKRSFRLPRACEGDPCSTPSGIGRLGSSPRTRGYYQIPRRQRKTQCHSAHITILCHSFSRPTDKKTGSRKSKKGETSACESCGGSCLPIGLAGFVVGLFARPSPAPHRLRARVPSSFDKSATQNDFDLGVD